MSRPACSAVDNGSDSGPCVLESGHLSRDHAGFHRDARGNHWRTARHVFATGYHEPVGIEFNGYPDTVLTESRLDVRTMCIHCNSEWPREGTPEHSDDCPIRAGIVAAAQGAVDVINEYEAEHGPDRETVPQ